MNIVDMLQLSITTPNPSWYAHFDMKDTIGSGKVQYYNFEDKLCLITVDSTFKEKITIFETNKAPHYVLNFVLKGSYLNNFSGERLKEFNQGSVNFFSFSQEGTIIGKEDEHVLYLSIFITAGFLASMAGPTAYIDRLLNNLEKPLDENRMFYQSQYDPRVQMILYDILNSPYAGQPENESVNHIYLKSKLLELIALFFNTYSKPPAKGETQISPDEYEKLQLAKQILISEIDNPPSLADLARRIYLNEFKLKNGFKHLFGTTVYGYLRDFRLEKARRLLEQGDMNVAEISVSIGYNNPSHFAATFKNKYGINPGMLLTGQKKYFYL